MQNRATAFIRTFVFSALSLASACFAFILLLDPYGVSPVALPIQRPIMDINQRYMYPQIVRTRQFDSVVIGTSTSRLLNPEDLDSAFGGRFANLAMNAATAWEQSELLKLYLRHNPQPRMVVIGLDHVWCQPGQNIARTTFRGFPAWMYDENRWNDVPEVFNLKTLEITGRLAAFQLGLMPERIRRDGYEVFTPPETHYDLARARTHIWAGHDQPQLTPQSPASVLSPAEQDRLAFEALAWLETLLKALPADTRRALVYMPAHVAAQPVTGSENEAVLSVCKERIDRIARAYQASVVDFAIPSVITTEDANYWDPLHYRLPIARRVVDGMSRAILDRTDSEDGAFRIR